VDAQSEHESAAFEVAARALRLRDVSASALERELAAAGIDELTRRKALDQLTDTGLVDDARLARVRGRSLAERGYGDLAIAARLAEAGVGSDAGEQAIAELEPEEARARALAAARPSRDPRALGAFLSRRGFAPESIEAALGVLDDLGPAELR
jgi:SOS response regulatory protein OraA/RecX